ncbi:MAG TPA: hypothetical protein VF533_03860, partial [Solirubrobacteraceae bacterium]
LVSLWSTARDAHGLVVDHGSAPGLVEQLAVATAELGYGLERLPAGANRAAAVNAGLAVAVRDGADALVVDPRVELVAPSWLERMRARTDGAGRPAAVVGARLIDGDGLLEHAGMFFSLLRREFFHRFRFGPANLPEALEPTRCPVSQSLQLIRHETLVAVGRYDEDLDAGYEGVDFCLRAFAAGLECIYEPSAVARIARDEAPEDVDARIATCNRFFRKHDSVAIGRWVPEAI